MALKMHPSISVHAGRWLMTEIVEPSGRNITELAAEMDVSRQALSTVLNGHASPSAEMALLFEREYRISADTLTRMQTSFDNNQWDDVDFPHRLENGNVTQSTKILVCH
jgi:antitoxin HigA-1